MYTYTHIYIVMHILIYTHTVYTVTPTRVLKRRSLTPPPRPRNCTITHEHADVI